MGHSWKQNVFLSVSVHSCNFTRDISVDNCFFLKKCSWYTFYQVFSCSVTSARIAAICFTHLMYCYIHSILYCSYSLQLLFHAPNFKIARVFATVSVFTPSILFNLKRMLKLLNPSCYKYQLSQGSSLLYWLYGISSRRMTGLSGGRFFIPCSSSTQILHLYHFGFQLSRSPYNWHT